MPSEGIDTLAESYYRVLKFSSKARLRGSGGLCGVGHLILPVLLGMLKSLPTGSKALFRVKIAQRYKLVEMGNKLKDLKTFLTPEDLNEF